MFVFLFLVSVVSAMNWDDKVNFVEIEQREDQTKDYGKYEIYNSIFLGIGQGELLQEYTLLESDNSIINRWAILEVKNYRDSRLMENLKVYGDNIRNIESYYWVEETVITDKPIYKEVCEETLNKNGTQICNSELDRIEKIEEINSYWKKYNGELLKAGVYKLRINARGVNPNGLSDWVLVSGEGEKDLREWAWWNSTWKRKQNISLYENTGSDFVDYPVKLNITYERNMQNDFEDLRFTDHSETIELDYWMPSYHKSDGNSAIVYVRANMTANQNNSIFMYYKNLGSTTTSSYEETTRYDDFEDGSIDTTKWRFRTSATCGAGSSAWAESSGKINGSCIMSANPDFGVQTMNNTGWNWANATAIFDSSISYGAGNYYWGKFGFCTNKETGLGNYLCGTVSGTGSMEYLRNNLTWNGNYSDYSQVKLDGALSKTPINNDESKNYTLTFFTQGGGDDVHVITLYDSWAYEYIEIPPTINYGVEEATNELDVTLNNPIDYFNSTSNNIAHNCSSTDETGVLNLTLIINGIDNYTIYNLSASQNLSLNYTQGFAFGSYNWSCRAEDEIETFSTEERHFNIDTEAPIISNAVNLTNILAESFPVYSNWNYSVSDASLSQCYYNTSINTSLTFVTCNTPTINTNWTTGGNKSILYCANDTFGSETCNLDSIYIYSVTTSQTDTDPVGEGGVATFTLEVNMTDIPTTIADLVVNNTRYGGQTPSVVETNRVYFDYDLTIPDGWGNATGNLIDWYWEYTPIGIATNTSTATTNTTVYAVAFDDCTTYGELILNMSLYDEEDNDYLNATAGSNVEIDINLTSIDESESWTYHNQWTNNETGTEDLDALVCVPYELINNTNYTIDFTIGFSATDHVWEFFYLENGTLDYNTDSFDSLTPQKMYLMDLLTADSTSFLFNYLDADGLIIDDIIVHLFRKYIGEGTFREVERSKQNDDGDTVVHLVEEDVLYYFIVTQEGTIIHTSNTYTALCQTTPCTIILEEGGGFQSFNTTDWDLIDGGSYVIESDNSARTVNLTYALDSVGEMNLTVYKLVSDGSYSVIDSKASTGTAGSVEITVPTISGNTTFFASVYEGNTFKKSEWIDFEDDAGLYFGNTLSLFLGALIILTLGLMAVTEGSATIIFLIVGMVISSALGLIDYRASTGATMLIYLIVAGALIIWKLTRRNR